jgi:hypothetical protein
MARSLCERPGCSQPAEVIYGLDAGHLTVWIAPLDRAGTELPGVLCRRHADAMVVPLRWTLDDRREAVPRLFRAPATPQPPVERPKRVRTPRAAPPAQLPLAAQTPPGDDGEPTPVDPTSEIAWRPVFDQTDDLDGLLHAQGRLLSRAFNGSGRQHPSA